MDKQKELNAYEQMAVVCARWFSCGTCPYNPAAHKESICPNFDKKLVYAMGKGYRKIPDGAVVVPDMAGKDFYTIEKSEWDKMVQGAKDIIRETRKETAEKFAERLKLRLFEYMDNDVSYDEFCKANIVCDEIDEIYEEITEGEA